jgi:acetyl esterase/lipase
MSCFAEEDVLRDEGRAYVVLLQEVGMPAGVVVWPGTVHAFLTMAALAPHVYAAATTEIASWIALTTRNGTAMP